MPGYKPRGIGKNWLPCFICGGDESLKDDMAAFVEGKSGGEEVVALFTAQGLHAKLDFRPYEPNWVQVKVGACPRHKANLETLYTLTRQRGWISADIIKQVMG